MPDKDGDPRDSMIGLFSAIRRDYGPAGIRVELGHVGILPVWGENNRNELARGKAKAPNIHPVLIDRQMPRLQGRLDELNKLGQSLTAEQKQEFVDLTKNSRSSMTAVVFCSRAQATTTSQIRLNSPQNHKPRPSHASGTLRMPSGIQILCPAAGRGASAG
jgi:hypothetical protein